MTGRRVGPSELSGAGRGRSTASMLVLLTFCNIVLDYEKYEVGVGGDSAFRLRDTSSPLGSTGSTGSSHSLGSGEQREEAETNPRLPRASQHSDTDTVTGKTYSKNIAH